jgi:hypothetical protein
MVLHHKILHQDLLGGRSDIFTAAVPPSVKGASAVAKLLHLESVAALQRLETKSHPLKFDA